METGKKKKPLRLKKLPPRVAPEPELNEGQHHDDALYMTQETDQFKTGIETDANGSTVETIGGQIDMTEEERIHPTGHSPVTQQRITLSLNNTQHRSNREGVPRDQAGSASEEPSELKPSSSAALLLQQGHQQLLAWPSREQQALFLDQIAACSNHQVPRDAK